MSKMDDGEEEECTCELFYFFFLVFVLIKKSAGFDLKLRKVAM